MLALCVGMKPTNIHWITMAWLHPLQRAFLGPALIQQDAFMNFLKSCDKANGRVESTRHGCTCYQLLGENGCLACNIGCQFWNANKAKHIIHWFTRIQLPQLQLFQFLVCFNRTTDPWKPTPPWGNFWQKASRWVARRAWRTLERQNLVRKLRLCPLR